MNRDLAAAGGRREYGAPLYRRQTLALYALIDRLREAHPAVEIESCASGAGRADYGILKRTHRIWTSDNNDALERQTIQRGFSRFFSPEIMGAHSGPSPAHISHRCHTLAFRAATALFGHLGLELDISALSAEDRAALKDWIGLYKRFRTLLHNGRTYQLSVRPLTSRSGYGVVALGKQEALFAVVQLRVSRLRVPPPVYLPGLETGAVYRLAVPGPLPPEVTFDTPGQALKDGKLMVPGAVLADVGLQTPILPPETVLLLHLQRIQRG